MSSDIRSGILELLAMEMQDSKTLDAWALPALQHNYVSGRKELTSDALLGSLKTNDFSYFAKTIAGTVPFLNHFISLNGNTREVSIVPSFKVSHDEHCSRMSAQVVAVFPSSEFLDGPQEGRVVFADFDQYEPLFPFLRRMVDSRNVCTMKPRNFETYAEQKEILETQDLQLYGILAGFESHFPRVVVPDAMLRQ